MQGVPLKRARPPTIDRSSAKWRSPCSSSEVGEDLVHVVQRVGPLRMAGDLGDLPGRQAAVDVLGELQALLAQLVDLFGDVDRGFGLHIAQFFDLGFEFGDRLLEVEKGSFRQRLLLVVQYATGSGSSDRQMYQVATLRYGAQATATSRASLRQTGSPREIVVADAGDQAGVVQRQHVRAASDGRSGTSRRSSGRCRGSRPARR